MTYKMASAAPSAKVVAAAVAALLTPILLGLLARAFPDLPLPVDATGLVNTIVEGAVIGALTFAAGYVKAPAAADVPVLVAPKPPAGIPPA